MSLSYFTPSMNDPALLEAIFTAREPLAAHLISRIRDSVESGNRHYMLVIGPRGIGKSHLVSLIYYRVKADLALAEALRVAWLTEDPYSVDSYAGLLREILVQLNKEYGLPRWAEKLATIQNMNDQADIERALESALVEFVQPRVLLVISENLDTIFDNLQDTGQKKLRAFLQTKGLATLLATSPSLIPAAESRDRPFFGFFRNQPLEPLTLRDCIDMLVRLANSEKDTVLAEMLSSPIGQARVRAIHHLAGGNPRIYVIFYQFLTRDSLDTLVEPFMKLVNELVPYYQSRMQTISPQQRRLIDTIRKHESPMAVRDIAKVMFTSSQSASSDLGKLREFGYVTSTKVGRESLYELREPLMRICLAAKEQRGEALPLFVDFLRLWFTPAELRGFGEMSQRHVPEYERYEKVIQAARQQQAAKIAFDLGRARSYRQEGLEDDAIALLMDLFERAPEDQQVWWELFQSLEGKGRHAELVERARLRTTLIPDSAAAWMDLDYLCYMTQDFEAALQASTRAIELAPQSWAYQDSHLANLSATGRFVERRASAGQILSIIDRTESYQAAQLFAKCQEIQGDRPAAVSALIDELSLGRASYDGWQYLHVLLEAEEADDARLQISQFATTLFPTNPSAWRDHATALSVNGRRKEAVMALDTAIRMAPGNAEIGCQKLTFALGAGDLAGARAAAEDAKELLKSQPAKVDLAVLWALAMVHLLDGADASAAQVLRLYLERAAKDEFRRVRLAGLFNVLVLTRDPGTLSRFATLYVEAYEGLDALAALGNALVGSVLCSPSMSDYGVDLAALKRWMEAWQPFEQRKELALPIRLMSVALQFRESLDENALLALPVEQREMLRPRVERYKRWLGLAVHELDERIDALLSRVRSLRTPVQRPRPRWRPRPLDLDELLQGYSARRRVAGPLPYLAAGPWAAIPKQRAAGLLDRLDREALLGRSWTDPKAATRVLRIDAAALPFSAALLYQVHVDVGGRTGAIDVLADDSDIVALSGESQELHAFFGNADRLTLTPDAELDYIRFFCAAMRTDRGRFRVVDGEPGLRETLAALRPGLALPLPRRVEEEGRTVYEELMVYDGELFKVRLHREDAATVQMLEDFQLTTPLPDLRIEEFDGSVRFWAQPQAVAQEPARDAAT